MQPLVQVAGIIDRAEADLLLSEGVDWLGLPLRLPKHNEDISEADAAAVVAAVPAPHRCVVITYLDRAEEITAFCAQIGVTIIQLHGDVPIPELRALKAAAPELEVIKSLVVREDNADELIRTVETTAEWVDMYITDTYNPATGAKGATGLTHDWGVSAELVRRSPRPLILAGGLSPQNVAQAIVQVRPAGVDAHTSLENATGRKDQAKVREFVQQSRRAFAELAAELDAA
jgi:phosphoribosylanthranilate isomerase